MDEFAIRGDSVGNKVGMEFALDVVQGVDTYHLGSEDVIKVPALITSNPDIIKVSSVP